MKDFEGKNRTIGQEKDRTVKGFNMKQLHEGDFNQKGKLGLGEKERTQGKPKHDDNHKGRVKEGREVRHASS